MGGVLKQLELNEEGEEVERILSYFSRSFNKAERNYSTTERECLAIIASIRHFYTYLHMKQYEVITDHCPLKYLSRFKTTNSRILRWALLIQGEDMIIKHQSGAVHCEADCFSRLPAFMEEMRLEKPNEPLDEEIMTCSLAVNTGIPVVQQEELFESSP